MKKITLLVFTLLLSFAGYAQFPIPGTEGFENTTGPGAGTTWTLGTGNWAVFDNGVGLGQRWGINNGIQVPPLVYAGANAAYMNRENIGIGNTSEDYLATPLITIPANGQLRFFARTFTNGNTGTIYQVKIAPATASQTNPAAYTLIEEYTENDLTVDEDGVQNPFNIYTEKVIDIPTTFGTQVYISFVMKYTQTVTGISGDRWLLDNVRVAEKCLDPSALTATGILFNQANLSWANPSGATSWEIEIIPVASAPTGTGVVYNGALPYTATGLTPNTSYRYYVRALCGDGINSEWVGPFVFNTPIAPPICGGNYLDPGAAANYGNNADNTVTICPVTPGDAVTVTFTTFNTEANADGLYVFNGATTSSPQITSTNPAGTVPGGLAGSFWGTSIPGPFTSSSPDGCLTFRFRSNATVVASGWTSNVTCAPAPTCPKPISVVRSGLTATSVNLSWTNTGTATAWEVLALPCGSPTPTATTPGFVTAPTNPFTLGGLTSDTCYDFYVRAVCSTTESSEWSTVVSGTTLQVPPGCGTTFSDPAGSGANYANNSNYTVTICPDIPGQVVTVTFTSFNTQATADGLYIYNGNSVTAPLMSSGNPAGTVPGGVAGSYWGTTNPGSFTSSSPDGCLTFRFRSGAATNAPGWTSNITCGPAPVCPQPQSLVTSAVTFSSVNLAWTENGTATSWHVLALPCGSPAPTASSTGWVTAGTNPYTLNGLTSETCYDIYVRSACSTSDFSTWLGPRTITTLIAPPVCGGTFVDNGGSFANYLNNSDVTWTVCPTIPGEQVTVTFTSFSVETAADGLYVFNGNSTAAEQIISLNGPGTVPGGLAGAFWGTTIPGPFTSSNPNGCLTFRFRSGATNNSTGWLANVTCNPAPTCLVPTGTTVLATTVNSVTVGWTENGTATAWQVLVLPFAAPAPTAASTGWQDATTNPYTYTGLNSGTQYKVYVRSVCSTTDSSAWSFQSIFNTLISNDECANAVVAVVNPDTACGTVTPGTIIGATPSPDPSTCPGSDDDDVWFQFTATSPSHLISLIDITGSTTNLVHGVYTGSCGTLTQIYCSDPEQSLATGLVIGQVYYIRVYTSTATPNQSSIFNLCIGTLLPPIATSTTTYTNLQLIEDILLNSTCANVSNITSSGSTNFGATPANNSIGYFSKNGSGFPFNDGIVLSSGFVNNSPGPNDAILSDTATGWVGDADLEAIILAATGQTMNSQNATKLEFDFVPLTDQISFNFIFASDEYGTFQCSFSDAFAFLLTNTTTNVTTNLAVVPNTTTPISVVTIRDALFNTGCSSVNPEYFGTYYGAPNGENILAAPINFNGSTIPMTASATVVPGTQYHIKLVVADRSDSAFDSAVFLEGGSFDIGNVELGTDFLVSNNNALCYGSSYLIQSGLDPADYTFTWEQNGVVIPNQTGPNLIVLSNGTYTVNAQFIGTTCLASDSLVIEFYNEILQGTPVNLTACNSSTFAQFDLSQNNTNTLGSLNPADYNIAYYPTVDDADNETNALPLLYTNTVPNLQTIYIRLENNLTGCYLISEFNLIVQDLTPQFTITPNQSICAGTTGTITVTPTNYVDADVTYSWSLDGNPFPGTTGTITVSQAGTYSVLINNSGCTATGQTVVTVTPIPVPDDPIDVTSCGSYVLPTLTNGSYYTGSNGTGTLLLAGETVTSTQTIYVFATSGTVPNCTAENSFLVTITPLTAGTFNAIPTLCQNATAPTLPTTSNNGFTGSWNPPAIDTSVVGTFNYVFTPDAGQCADTTTIAVTIVTPTVATFTQINPICSGATAPSLPLTSTNGITGTWSPPTIDTSVAGTFTYTFTTSAACATGTTMNVVIVPSPNVSPVANVNACDSYTLPALTVGNYFTGAGGTGSQLAAGTVLNTNQTVYVYAANTNGTTTCSDEESFVVTITTSPQFTVEGGCDGAVYVLEVVGANFDSALVTYSWTGPSGTAVGTNSPIITATTPGNYTCQVTIGSCSTSFVFEANSTTCLIQKGISPNNDDLNDSFDLTGFNVKQLTLFNRYGGKVYAKANYTNEWRGQSEKGDELPDGTYYYVIERDGMEAKTGWVYINREIN